MVVALQNLNIAIPNEQFYINLMIYKFSGRDAVIKSYNRPICSIW